MKPLRTLFAGLALAALSTPAWAVQIPVTGDTAGNPVTNIITKKAGAATSLPISARSQPILFFNLSNSGITSGAVTGARLILYFPRVITAGNLTPLLPTGAFQETFPSATIPLSANGAGGSPVAITAANSRGYVVIPGFQTVVQSWLTTPASNTGIALVADATLNALISSREGAGAGAAAILEIDVNPSGAISPTTVTTTGDITSGGGLTVTGGVTGATVNSTGLLTAGSISSMGTASFGSITTGAIGATSVTATGTISGAGGTFSGLTLSGALNGTSGNFTSLTVRDPDAQTGTIQVGGTGANSDPKFIKFGDGNNVRIGENGVDDQMQFDASNYVFNTGNVGIGTAPGSFKLNVSGSLNTGALTGTTGTFSGNVLFNGSVGIGGLDPGAAVFNIFSATNNRRMKVETGSNTQFAGYDAKTPTSSWYMGTDTAPSKDWVLFDANSGANRVFVSGAATSLGNVGIGATPVAGFRLNVGGSILCTGFLNTSDARFKKDITSITLGLDTVKKLRPVTYDWRRDEFPDRNFDAVNHSGFIAQEIGQVLPNVVTETGGGYKAVNYVEVIPVLTRAIQELAEAKDAEIAALKEKLAASEARRTALDAEIQARLAKLEAAAGRAPARVVTAALEVK